MPPFNRDEEDQDDTFDQVAAMADRLGLKGQKRAAYIDDHMQGMGYEPVQTRETYVRPKPTEGGDEGGRGGFGKRWGFGQSAGPGGGGGRGGRDDDDRY